MTTKRHTLNQITLYPLRFQLIYQYRLWGGRRLAKGAETLIEIARIQRWKDNEKANCL
jgi:hypothetical protein